MWSLACLRGNRVEAMNSHQFQRSTHASPFQVLEAQQASDRKISWNYWDQWNETQRVKCQTRKNMLRISRVLLACFFRLALVIHWDVFLFSHLLLFLLAVVGVVVANKAVLMLWSVHSQFGAFIIMSRLICFLGCSISGLFKRGVSEAPQKIQKKSLETQVFQKAATHPLWVSSSKTSCEARFSQPIPKPPRQTWFAGHPNGFSLVGLSNIRSVPRKHWKSFRDLSATQSYHLPPPVSMYTNWKLFGNGWEIQHLINIQWMKLQQDIQENKCHPPTKACISYETTVYKKLQLSSPQPTKTWFHWPSFIQCFSPGFTDGCQSTGSQPKIIRVRRAHKLNIHCTFKL